MTRRILHPAALALGAATLGALALAGCATRGEGRPGYVEEIDQLRAECAERGGVLMPIPGAISGRPRSDNVCEIRGGGSRIRD